MSKKDGTSVTETVLQLATPIAQRLGLDIWDVEFKKEGTLWYLRVMLDKDGGVDINDCEMLSRELSDLLDEKDPITQSYCLEVGSAGIDRVLKRDGDFERFMNEMIEIKLYQPRDKIKSFVGKLIGYNGGTVEIETEGKCLSFEKGEYSSVRLYPEF